MLSHWAACFGLVHIGRRISITRIAASAKVGVEGTGLRTASLAACFSAKGGRALQRTAVRLEEARERAWTRLTVGVGSQTDVPALSVDHDTLDPGLGTGGSDIQVEAVAVAVPAGLTERLCRECGELAHFHTFPHIFPHDTWDLLAFYDAKWEGSRDQYH